MKNTYSEPKRRSHRIAHNLEFSNTQDDPKEIEEAENEGSVKMEKINFTKDESKKQDSSAASEGGHSSNDLPNLKRAIFNWSGHHWANSSGHFTFNCYSEHFTFHFLPFYQL